MKASIFSLVVLSVLFVGATALAHPGTHTLTCTSAANKTNQITFKLHRFNGTGWSAPTMELTTKGKTYNISPEDEDKTYGSTVHDSPLGIIHIDAGTNDSSVQSYFTVKAIPKSVQAFSSDGKPVHWNLNSENDECNDSNGKAKFKGVFCGYLELDSKNSIKIDAEIMDCELEYNSGMAC